MVLELAICFAAFEKLLLEVSGNIDLVSVPIETHIKGSLPGASDFI
jgi:hypothetical protein